MKLPTPFGRESCTRHQEALLDFIDRRRPDPSMAPALAHLERCGRCEREVAATALVLAGLRRLASESRELEPPAGGWRLDRARLRGRSTWAPAGLALAKAGASVAVLTALMAPMGLGPASPEPVAELAPAADQKATAPAVPVSVAPQRTHVRPPIWLEYEQGALERRPAPESRPATRDPRPQPARRS